MIGDILVFVSPAYILAVVIASIYGLAFFVFLGQGWKQMLVFWVTAVAGFLIGQAIAQSAGLRLFNIGSLNLVEGSIASAFALIAVRAWVRSR
jgi:hypothetical protein